MKDTGGLDTRFSLLRANTDYTPVHPPLAGENAECTLHRQPGTAEAVVEHSPPPGQVSPWKRTHQVLLQWKGLISHKDMRHRSKALSCRDGAVLWEVQCPTLQSLTKGRVGQGPTITAPPIAANIYNSEPVIDHRKEHDGVCALVVMEEGAAVRGGLDNHMLATHGAQAVREVPPL